MHYNHQDHHIYMLNRSKSSSKKLDSHMHKFILVKNIILFLDYSMHELNLHKDNTQHIMHVVYNQKHNQNMINHSHRLGQE